jgi:hypothetical protein
MDAPRPGAGEVLVRVYASGVNPGEVKKRADWMGFGIGYPRVIPHSDGAGVIEGVSPPASESGCGCGAQSGKPFGTAAEYTAVPEAQAVRLPDRAQQAGIPLEAMAKALLVGMYTVGFPLTPLTPSFFLLVGLAGVNIGADIRHMLPWAWLVSMVMLISAIILGQIPFHT